MVFGDINRKYKIHRKSGIGWEISNRWNTTIWKNTRASTMVETTLRGNEKYSCWKVK